ncbi:hypothetical protein [uncultured Muribaculum sp.]|uniref:hypothetical protein n=1 Tax=uncultured Muribaculum sp. TaxID=1918613 RepID=UPI0025CEA577|nr:hypothetical protein [uncultured Muribaculum sp.]
MTQETPVQSAAKEVYEMLLRRQAFEAMQLADEITADAISQWQRDASPANACDLLVASCALSESQIAAGRLKPALNTALRALAHTSTADTDAEPRMMCTLSAWNALEQLLNLTIPDDTRRDAVASATGMLGSLLYHYYYATGRANPECAALNDAYDALRVITSLVRIDSAATPATTLPALISSIADAGLAE